MLLIIDHIQLWKEEINVGVLDVENQPLWYALLAKKWNLILLISALRTALRKHGPFTN